jgi:hypothetical protein
VKRHHSYDVIFQKKKGLIVISMRTSHRKNKKELFVKSTDGKIVPVRILSRDTVTIDGFWIGNRILTHNS